MFEWFEALGLADSIFDAREHRIIVLLGASLPAWAIYSAPDALWTYSLTFFIADVWRDERRSLGAIVWISVGFAGGTGAELGQLLGVVPGIFDETDLWLCTAASSLAVMAALSKGMNKCPQNI
jgi:hypothetical protein